MSGEGRLFARPDSPTAPAAAALSWLWRLGPVLDRPAPGAVAFGAADEQDDLLALLEEGRLAGIVLLCPEPGPAAGRLPARRRAHGIARFNGGPLRWEFTVFEGGTPAVRTGLGIHAVRDGACLALALDPATAWTEYRGSWALEPLAAFLPELLGRPLVTLPPVGCVRLDDAPGTAQHQVQGNDKPDWRERRQIESMRRAYRRAGARLNVAVCSRALVDGQEASIEQVWPRSTAALAAGVSEGTFEPVCHGYLHLDMDEHAAGRVEYREFQALDEAEAGRRIDASVAWQQETLGRAPETFVAPAWSYSDGALAAAAARSLPAWLPPALEPLVDGANVHETANNGFRGLHRLGYRQLISRATHGLPPTPVLHGGLLDLRMMHLKASRDAVTFARLVPRRDIVRLAGLPGIRWIGAGEFLRILRAHDTITVRGSEIDVGDAGDAMLIDAAGARPVGAR